MTLDYMKNNVTENMWNQVLEKYKPFQEKQKGGPLFFKLMMNQLLSNKESAAKALLERVVKYDTGNIQGEDDILSVTYAQYLRLFQERAVDWSHNKRVRFSFHCSVVAKCEVPEMPQLW
jgi:hypothetical protein